jgi:hypothetical protein
LIIQYLAEGRLLFGRALQKEQHAIQGLRVAYGALVKFGLGEGMDVAAKEQQLLFVNGLSDSGGPGGQLRNGGITRLRGGGVGPGCRKQSNGQHTDWREWEGVVESP